MEQGAFGGTYFAVNVHHETNKNYNRFFDSVFADIDDSFYLSKKYQRKLNKFGVKSGLSYQEWYDKEWIHEQDPYGWYEWYIEYSLGRRTDDDERQIRRWYNICGPNGRWRNRIYANIYKKNDWNTSPIIQQTLHHWGYYVNEEHMDYYLHLRKNGHTKVL